MSEPACTNGTKPSGHETEMSNNDRAAAQRRATLSLEAMSDEEDAEIVRGAMADPENPPLTAENFRRMRPASVAAPEIVRRARGQRGPRVAMGPYSGTIRKPPCC
jgi:hypothetical protein